MMMMIHFVNFGICVSASADLDVSSAGIDVAATDDLAAPAILTSIYCRRLDGNKHRAATDVLH